MAKDQDSGTPQTIGTDPSSFEPDLARGWLSALPDFALGATFLIAWVAPLTLPAGTIPHLLLVILMEFIIIHSSVFLGNVVISPLPRKAKLIGMLAIGSFYTIFAGAFSLGFHSSWPLLSFWALMLNRMLGVLIGQAPSGQEKLLVQRTWAATAVFYLLFCALTIVLPIPHLGLTREAILSLHLPGRGAWITDTQRAMACGFFYFTAVALSEINGHALFGARGAAAPAVSSTPAAKPPLAA